MAEMTQQDVINLLIKTVKSGGNIADFSKQVGQTIAVTSRQIAAVCEINPGLQKVFGRWPQNVKSGYVFLGYKHLQVGEKNNMLKPGDYILATCSNKKRGFYEIWHAEKTVEHRYLIGNNDKEKTYFRVFIDMWFSEDDIQRGQLKYFAESHNCNAQIKITEDNIDLLVYKKYTEQKPYVRTVYRRGRWLGNIHERGLVSVNYNWK